MPSQYIIVKDRDKEYISVIFKILLSCGIDMARKGLFHWLPPYPKRAIRRDCNSNSVFVVFDETLAAYSSTFQLHANEDGSLSVYKLATLPRFKGKGVGGNNLSFIEEYARSSGCHKITFDVYIKSKDALAFYKKHGFEIVGHNHSLRFKEFVMEKVVL